MKPIGLCLGLIILAGKVYGIPTSFIYGCGTGCAVRATLVSKPQLGAGEIMEAKFRQTILSNGKFSSSGVRYFWATCSNYSIAFNDTNVFPDSGWKKLNTTDYSANYTTAGGGLGYYFDVLCPK
jgi:hypothetical protein